MSALERLKALDEQRAELLHAAKKEALDRAYKVIAELKELGFDFVLVERARRTVPQGQRKEQFETEAPRRPADEFACPVCGIATFPRHDGSAHTYQETKRPFTAEELAEAGLTPIEHRASMFDDTLPGS